MRHVCARCGGSCQGLRVRVGPEEKARLAADAESLGVQRPFDGPWLRQNWGVCVFYADGCRLHAELGSHRKPVVCRQFPVIGTTVDPSCFHSGDTGPPVDIDWEDLGPGLATRERLRTLPLVAILDSPHLGPMATAQLSELDRADPRPPSPEEAAQLEPRIGSALALAHGTERALLVGGSQLIVGADKAVGLAFAAWMRLLRTGVL